MHWLTIPTCHRPACRWRSLCCNRIANSVSRLAFSSGCEKLDASPTGVLANVTKELLAHNMSGIVIVSRFMRIIGCSSILLFSQPTSAGYVEAVKIRYHENYEFKQWKTVDVEFVTGTEISSRVSGYFPIQHNYAIVPLQNDRVIVLKLEEVRLCYGSFTKSCFPLSGKIHAFDKSGQAWEICTNIYCY